MPGDDVNISFNFTMSAEEAIELLTAIREKYDFHKNTKSTISPKRQTTQDGERDPRFGRIPLATIASVVDKLSAEYSKRVFSYGEAHALATRNNIARTTLGYALRYGASQGRIKKLALGRYTFGPVTDYSANPDSVLDLVSKDSIILIPVLKMMSEVSDIVNLYFSDQAVTARFRNHDNNAMLDVRIRSYGFDVMHVKGHVKLTVSCKQLVRVLSKRTGKRGAIHLQLSHAKDSIYRAGFLGDEHSLIVLGCESSDKPYDIERPLDAPQEGMARIEMPQPLLKDILENIRSHSEDVLISCRKEGAVAVFAAFDSSNYRKELADNGHDIRLNISEDVRGCFPLSIFLPLLKVPVAKDSVVRLLVIKSVLVVQLVSNKEFLVQYFIAPSKVEEAAPSVVVARDGASARPPPSAAEMKALTENISRLEKEMGIDKSKKG